MFSHFKNQPVWIGSGNVTNGGTFYHVSLEPLVSRMCDVVIPAEYDFTRLRDGESGIVDVNVLPVWEVISEGFMYILVSAKE